MLQIKFRLTFRKGTSSMHVLILLNNKQGFFSSYNTTRGYNTKRHIWQQTKNYYVLYFPLHL